LRLRVQWLFACLVCDSGRMCYNDGHNLHYSAKEGAQLGHTTTRQWNIHELAASAKDEAYARAAAVLREGGTVAFPTETVYGLGADARDSDAVARIFEAKGRPSDNPLIVHIADRAQLADIVLPSGPIERALMDACWPGPLTIVMPARPGAVSPRVTAGLDTVAVRMPDHPVALRLIAEAGCPVAAPSANRSGRPSPTTAEHVREDLDGLIDGLIDGGPAEVGLESTVVEVDGEIVRVLRPGGVTVEELRAASGCEVVLDESLRVQAVGVEAADRMAGGSGGESDNPEAASAAEAAAAAEASVTVVAASAAAADADVGAPATNVADAADVAPAAEVTAATHSPAPRSPGMKYAHYAPRGEMTLALGAADAVRAYIAREAAAAHARGLRTGVLTYDEHAQAYADVADVIQTCGRLAQPSEAARRLYAALRAFDEQAVERIWAEGVDAGGIGLALMNRLAKAAGGRVVHV
jgi:L-threonylcarbamoyladenylate synthase